MPRESDGIPDPQSKTWCIQKVDYTAVLDKKNMAASVNTNARCGHPTCWAAANESNRHRTAIALRQELCPQSHPDKILPVVLLSPFLHLPQNSDPP